MPNPTKLATTLEALGDDFAVFSSTANLPTKAQLTAIEKALGVPLPSEHRALLEAYGALAVVANEAAWPRPVEFEVRPAWQFCFGVEVFGFAPTAPALDVLVQSERRAPATTSVQGKTKGKKAPAPARFVAAMARIGDSSTVGYDAEGTLYEWDRHGDEAPRRLETSSLVSLLCRWIDQLAEDTEKIKREPPNARAPKASKATPKGGAKPGTKAKTKSVKAWVEELLDDDADGEEVGEALMQAAESVRGEVIAKLVKGIDEDETDGLWALAHLEADPRAVEALVSFASANTESTELRTSAIGVLGALDHLPPRALEVLIEALGDEDADVVQEAAEALAENDDPIVLDPLRAALAKAQRNPRWVYGVLVGNLLTALASAGGDRPAILDVLTANLDPPESHYAALPAFRALIALGPRAKHAIPALEAAVQGNNLYLTTLARHALGAITGDYAPHEKALQKAAKHEDAATQSVASMAIKAAEMAEILRTTD
jgi:HEAT repeat protein